MKKFEFAILAQFVTVCGLTQLCDAAQMALKLEGDPESYFEAPDHSGLDADLGSVFTVEAWVNPTTNLGDDTHPNEYMIVNKGSLQVAVQPAGLSWEWWNSNGTIPTNKWTHVAATWDGLVIRTFVDGKFLLAFDKTGADGAPGVLRDTDASLKVGRRVRGGDTHSIYKGLIDEVRISKVIRYTEAGFAVPTSAFTPDPGTVALYHFDEAIAGVVADASSFANHGMLVSNAVLVPANTPITPALPTISATRTADGLSITFTATLESANDLKGPWTVVSGSASPLPVQADQSRRFFRSRSP
ncbi:MAG: hypothetical protein DME26_02715 [Verrucomicrobia bacterium]|nr:MAG: hypothetical protein DME26_02715 [Verrucomicrobiota bacterium]